MIDMSRVLRTLRLRSDSTVVPTTGAHPWQGYPALRPCGATGAALQGVGRAARGTVRPGVMMEAVVSV